MKNAVIYARYSSYKQNEMSIEGQIDECRHYAEEHDMFVIREYIDRAQTATTDRRHDFLRMIDDSEYGNFEVILVYQLDRFARNKNDSGYYKKILADRGVKVVSAREFIAEDSSGVITEGMIESYADYFSRQLSEKVVRGMRQRAKQFKYNGGGLTYGYRIDEDGYYQLDEKTAPIVKEIFERIASGETSKSVMDDLNSRGIRTGKGNPFGKSSFQNLLKNEKYKGTYKYDDIVFPNAIPRIVSDELFDEVQEVRKNRTHGHRPAIEDYILSGKLYCGHCKTLMIGTSGTSRHGTTYRYYTCTHAPKTCDKKNIRKDHLEPIVLETCRSLLSDAVIDKVVKAVIAQNKIDEESPELIRLRDEIKSTESKIERLLDQIEEGLNSIRAAERLKQREQELSELKRQMKKEEAKQTKLDPAIIRDFLVMIRDGDFDNIQYQKMLVNTLIDRIYLYDDHFLIMLNYSGRKGKLSSKEAAGIVHYFDSEGSATVESGLPRQKRLRPFFFMSDSISHPEQ